MISVKEIKAEDTYLIRKEELRKNMDLPFQFTRDLDKDTFHVGLFYHDELISVVSFMKTKHKELIGEQYQLRGMATRGKFQGKGFGKMLVKKSEKMLKNKKVDIVWCNARVIALNFYKNIGFEVVGKPFNISQIGEHYMMFNKLV